MPAKKKQDQAESDDKTTVADLMPTTPDLRAERLAELRRLFPDLFDGEGHLNEKELRQLANPDGMHLKERYEFTWTGKQASKEEAFKPSKAALVYDDKRSVNPDKANGNLIIEGENLEVLKQLTSAYRGQVKLIYIDPPYNTGKDFVYSDRFAEDKKPYWEEAGITERGVKVDTNTDTDGRYHSNWLTMMHSRLLAARYLLRDVGAIFVSCDDNEVHNLRRLMDSVFGESNFVALLVWEGAGKNDPRQIGISHEYVVVYAKDRDILPREWHLRKEAVEPVLKQVQKLRIDHKDDYEAASKALGKWFLNQKASPVFAHRRFRFIDKRGAYKEDDPTAPGGRKFDLIHPATGQIIPLRRNRGWGFDQETFNRLVEEERVTFVTETSIMIRRYLHETEHAIPQSVFYQPVRSASERLDRNLGGMIFEYPKDETVIGKFIEMATDESDNNAIILDFFAGSGTTAQAVMDLNAVDGGNRKHILVQLPELTAKDSAAYKAGYKRISDITIERNKRVIERYRDEAVAAEKHAKQTEQTLAEAEKQTKQGKLPGMSDDKQLSKLRDTAEHARKEADQKKVFADTLGFKVYTLEKSAFPRVDFVPDPDATEEANVAKFRQYIKEKEHSFHMTWDRERILDEVLLKNGLMLDYTLEAMKDFKDNTVQQATDGSGRSYLLCLDDTIAPGTVDAFKKPPYKGRVFICLEKALDSTTKWNLKHHLGELLRAM